MVALGSFDILTNVLGMDPTAHKIKGEQRIGAVFQTPELSSRAAATVGAYASRTYLLRFALSYSVRKRKFGLVIRVRFFLFSVT